MQHDPLLATKLYQPRLRSRLVSRSHLVERLQHPWFHVRRLPARSHFPMLEVPEMVATEIEHFMASE